MVKDASLRRSRGQKQTVKNVQLSWYQYLTNETSTNQMWAYLAIVGDMDKAEAEKVGTKYFAKWQKAKYRSFTLQSTQIPQLKNGVGLVDRSSSVQNCKWHRTAIDLTLGDEWLYFEPCVNQIFGWRSSFPTFQWNLREDKGYTYGAIFLHWRRISL